MEHVATSPLADLTTGTGDAERAELEQLERTWH
jgi:hypothetical protein